ncbi:MAG TPA: SOS response-associated peptidase [Paenibacillus sp.]
MCGRYSLTVTLEELMLRYQIDAALAVPYHHPQYNIAPTQLVVSVIHDGQNFRLGELRWGLVPSWAKDESMGSRMINARSETLKDKPAYKIPFARKRCLIPADGFYEWQKRENSKQPYRITLRSGSMFSFAGLYDTWIAPDGSKTSTCTIITTTPNSLMAPIHDRMPVILKPEDEMKWLNRKEIATPSLQQLLVPYPAEVMQADPVSTEVNSVRNDSPSCIAKLT